MTKSKTPKVILFIVEGESDEIILSDYLDLLFKTEEVVIDVQRGDILSDLDRNDNIKITLTDVIKAYMDKSKITAKDIFHIFQITDADGCYIDDSKIVVNTSLSTKTLYESKRISVISPQQKTNIERRNKKKKKNINILSTLNYVTANKIHLPYKIYYFSTNLEHVTMNERNEDMNRKNSSAEDFIDNLTISLEEFLWEYSEIKKENINSDSYKDSWNILKNEEKSLERLTNVPLLFELIKDTKFK